ncbi:hypothetical protein LINPERHAP1_LOCUS7651 [Linum perenne]
MKELRRRGMTPASLLEESKKGAGVGAKRNAVQTEIDKGLSNQRERSMALNSEGLEGLIPRARVLLTTGGTFFLGFGPLILVTVGFFSALYLVSFLMHCFQIHITCSGVVPADFLLHYGP